MPPLQLEILCGSRHLPSFTITEVATVNPFSYCLLLEPEGLSSSYHLINGLAQCFVPVGG